MPVESSIGRQSERGFRCVCICPLVRLDPPGRTTARRARPSIASFLLPAPVILLCCRVSTLGDTFAFNDLDVGIQRQVCKFVHLAAWPSDLNAIDLCSRSKTQHLARVVRCQITATSGFQPAPPYAACLP